MKKIVRLTEKDLTHLIKKVIQEQDDDMFYEFRDNMVLLTGANSKYIQKTLNRLPKSVRFIAFRDCDYIDFNNVDLCNDFQNLFTINLMGTESNFEELYGDCFEEVSPSLYQKL